MWLGVLSQGQKYTSWIWKITLAWHHPSEADICALAASMGHLKAEVATLAALKPALDSLATRLEDMGAKFAASSSNFKGDVKHVELLTEATATVSTNDCSVQIDRVNDVYDDKIVQSSLDESGINAIRTPAIEGSFCAFLERHCRSS